MRIFFVALTLLAGCTSVNEMRDQAPRAAYDSTRSAGAVVQCIATEVRGHGQPNVIPGDPETIITYNPTGGNTVMVVSVRPTDGGSHIEVRQALDYYARPAVERCVA